MIHYYTIHIHKGIYFGVIRSEFVDYFWVKFKKIYFLICDFDFLNIQNLNSKKLKFEEKN